MPETPFNPDIDYPHLARKQAVRISELEAENRRMREALTRVHQYLCALQTVSDDLGPHVSSKSVDEHEAIARAALSPEAKE